MRLAGGQIAVFYPFTRPPKTRYSLADHCNFEPLARNVL